MATSLTTTEWVRPIREHLLGRLSERVQTWASDADMGAPSWQPSSMT